MVIDKLLCCDVFTSFRHNVRIRDSVFGKDCVKAITYLYYCIEMVILPRKDKAFISRVGKASLLLGG